MSILAGEAARSGLGDEPSGRQERALVGRSFASLAATARGAGGFVVLILLFEAARALDVVPPSSVPSTTAITTAVVDGFVDGQLAGGLFDTTLAWFLGVLLAMAIGVPLGIAVGLSRWADSALNRVVELLRPVPVVALIPMAIVLFGIELSMQVFLIAIACVWPVLLGTRGGVRAVDPLQSDTARVFGLGRLGVVRRVVLPASLPGIVTSLRVGASLGLIVAVAAELISGSPGLGRVLIENQRSGKPDTVWAVLVVTGLLGVCINAVLARLEHLVAGWQAQSTEAKR